MTHGQTHTDIHTDIHRHTQTYRDIQRHTQRQIMQTLRLSAEEEIIAINPPISTLSSFYRHLSIGTGRERTVWEVLCADLLLTRWLHEQRLQPEDHMRQMFHGMALEEATGTVPWHISRFQPHRHHLHLPTLTLALTLLCDFTLYRVEMINVHFTFVTDILCIDQLEEILPY